MARCAAEPLTQARIAVGLDSILSIEELHAPTIHTVQCPGVRRSHSNLAQPAASAPASADNGTIFASGSTSILDCGTLPAFLYGKISLSIEFVTQSRALRRIHVYDYYEINLQWTSLAKNVNAGSSSCNQSRSSFCSSVKGACRQPCTIEKLSSSNHSWIPRT